MNIRFILQDLIRKVPDFPVLGVLFCDITTRIGNREAYHQSIHQLAEQVRKLGSLTIIAATDARS
ncbi:MAG: hypothetical protein LBE79_10305 [Tannerella sp.]|jgi:adenine/guanine phosphoribosyltransferase-like PRPP-binding protein|nr:hypothetical protein [Tannerella sp.]